jgi:ABC transporter with metal-binding/Fe-S-binding domain ATP-binding protein
LFSGGKDSCYAYYLAKKHETISCLITVHSENKESYMFHTPNINLVEIQAKAIGVPIIVKRTKGIKEQELDDLREAIQIAINKYKIKGIVTGAVKSVYQATRIQKICNELNVYCFNPLWQVNDFDYLSELIQSGFKVIVSGVFAYPLKEDFLGKELNLDFEREILISSRKFKISPIGEGGEFETFVYDGPIFKRPIKIIEYKKEYNNYTGTLTITKVKLG